MRSVGPRSSPRPLARHLRLPLRLADFSKRGFSLDHPAARRVLETHARAFLTGFNVVAGTRDPHRALAGIPGEERGFAYEGAGMRAALTDLATGGRARAFERLLAGPGQGYVHLVHVGYGWGLVPARLPLPVLIPRTPLLRWLALDGAGFAEVYFGGVAALRRRCARAATPRWEARLAGCGRALWFLASADVDGVAGLIRSVPLRARSPLWAGVGLAAAYAGCVDEQVIDRLVTVCEDDVPQLKQGALFAIAARVRSGIVPAHTELACRRLFSVSPREAASWTDTAAAELTGSSELAAYMEWKSRLRTALVRLS
jgi:hypothetical protein